MLFTKKVNSGGPKLLSCVTSDVALNFKNLKKRGKVHYMFFSDIMLQEK